MGGVLSGYRVLDLTDEKGMLCTKLLADMGAEVIRVENPQRTGEMPASVAIDRCSPSFYYLNAGKRSVSLNLERKAGQDLFKNLVNTAQVVVESNLPGYLKTLGLDYSELSRINPGLVMASVTDFGQSGPYRGYKSCELVTSALGGQMYVNGRAESPPLKPFGNQVYNTTCLFAASGILLALWHRHVAGTGQYIDVSAMECAAATLDHVLVRYFSEEVVAKRQGSLHWNNAFRIFPCRDGYILLSLLQQWETLVEWLDDEGMAEDLTGERWQNREERLKYLDHIVAVLERWTNRHMVAELVEKGQLMRFPWAEVTTIPELVCSPQMAERGFFVEIGYQDSDKKYKSPGALCQSSRSPWQVQRRVPALGEHNLEIYHQELGLSVEEVDNLMKSGII